MAVLGRARLRPWSVPARAPLAVPFRLPAPPRTAASWAKIAMEPASPAHPGIRFARPTTCAPTWRTTSRTADLVGTNVHRDGHAEVGCAKTLALRATHSVAPNAWTSAATMQTVVPAGCRAART